VATKLPNLILGRPTRHTLPPLTFAAIDTHQEDLAPGLTGRAGLSTRPSLEDLLTEVASFAVQVIPGADGVDDA
jgi:hypothetical protein